MARKLLSDWSCRVGFDETWLTNKLDGEHVFVPHNAVDLPWNYGDERAYQRQFTYQTRVDRQPERDEGVFALFEGAMANAHVWINGKLVAEHKDGYTPFEADLTTHLQTGSDNLLTVRVDGTENPSIPPFGGRIDYLTYAGIYRDVWLETRPQTWIDNVKVSFADPLSPAPVPHLDVFLSGIEDSREGRLRRPSIRVTIEDPQGSILQDTEISDLSAALPAIIDPKLWSPDEPNLYRVMVSLSNGHSLSCNFGIRRAEFRPEGFFLNGDRLQIVGLNRHQSFPHVGYALGPQAQETDADILKFELGLNLVRTSHYPQSTAFLDRCDEIGLMVFEEIPGWQHIGADDFKAQSLANVGAMIRRDWNHPSIILWGVRINESPDDDAFYAQTNALARKLDPTRQTGGVRCIADSTLLEDVYTMNDFVLGEEHLPPHLQSRANRPRTPLRSRKEVTGLMAPVPYLVTEYNGHMYPTKLFDGEERQEEHVRRHLEVLSAAFADPEISGSIGWCMADYNTHADFGSGDRICYHGVLTMGRVPKFAAAVYASQGLDPKTSPVLEPVTHWSFGDRRVGGVFPLIILTNCDRVDFQFGDDRALHFQPDREAFPHLSHPPIIIDTMDIPEDLRVSWGDRWKDGVFTGFLGDSAVVQRKFVADPVPTRLAVNVAPRTEGISGRRYSDHLVRITALDQADNRLPFFMDQLTLTLEGSGAIQGPSTVPMIGGAATTYVRHIGEQPCQLSVSSVSGLVNSQTVGLDG